jgi:superfamily II DNA/RNA helicase
LEEIETDSKLDRLVGYLSNTLEEKETMHISVWTSYLSTAEYLWATLDDVFPMVYLITGAMPVEDRIQVVKEFEEKGGILISTDASSQGLELSFVDQNINYDMPSNEMRMEIRWGRFDRFGRKKPFKMLALLDDNNVFEDSGT